jgi:glycosyltransferase involved in cell wall biosynthesis
MRVLIVANHNTGKFSPFVVEQVEAIKKQNIEIDFFGVEGKGYIGYLSNLGRLKKKIDSFKPDFIHAHYGLSGLLANLQRKIPVVTTFHGSDINTGGVIRFLSKLAIYLSWHNIFVSPLLVKVTRYHGKNMSVIPCGIDTSLFRPMNINFARTELGWDENSKYILFSGSFDNWVKNPELAKAGVEVLRQRYAQYRENVQFLELKGYSRQQIAMLLNAADCTLMTSHTEGSPQIIKEAIACGCPIVSVDVGDVSNTIKEVDGCFIVQRTPEDIAEGICRVLDNNKRVNGLERIIELSLSNDQIAKRIIEIYNKA